MPPHTTPGRFKCTAFGCAAGGAIERLPDHDPRQQRGEGHSRSYSETSITASQATRMLLHVVPGQPVCLNSQSPHKLPRQEAPAYRPPKGTRAAKCRCVLASSGSSSHRCPRLVWRPHAVCGDRATGVVALLPLHVPAVPFAAAGIPPHCGVAAACPCVFTPSQAAQRCALGAPRLLPPWTFPEVWQLTR